MKINNENGPFDLIKIGQSTSDICVKFPVIIPWGAT